MKIVVLDGYTLNPGDNPWIELEVYGDLVVHDRTSHEEFLARAAGADILLTNKTPIRREQIGRLPELKLICVLATGYNVVDTEAAAERGIPVCNVPIYGTDTVAQHVLALILEHTNRVGELSRAPNCLITPHIEWSSLRARRRLMRITADNIRAFLAGTPANVCNLPQAP